MREKKIDSNRGLKKRRARTGREPTYDCTNCGCKRYSPCDCDRKGERSDLPSKRRKAPAEAPAGA